MASIDDVYRKFGEVAEAAQLLETELGTLIVSDQAKRSGWITSPDPGAARAALRKINHSTLGRLKTTAIETGVVPEHVVELVERALVERNRLAHSFYRKHNNRRNSDEGRFIMLDDLTAMHNAIMDAYKAVLLLSGVDLDSVFLPELPTTHLKMD